MTRALGIDFGKARIGLAITDEIGLMAHPLETVPAQDLGESNRRGRCRKEGRYDRGWPSASHEW